MFSVETTGKIELNSAMIIYGWSSNQNPHFHSSAQSKMVFTATKVVFKNLFRRRNLTQTILQEDWWCFNAIFNNISVISWRSVFFAEETGGPGENHFPVASRLTRSVVIDTDYICSCNSNYHAITTTPATWYIRKPLVTAVVSCCAQLKSLLNHNIFQSF